MSQGVLGFKYEEEKHDTEMTGLAGLPVYLDLLHAMGLSELIGGVTSHIKLTRYSYNRLMFCNKG